MAALIVTVAGEVIVTHIAVEDVVLAVAGVLLALHPPDVEAATTTVAQLGAVIHMYLAIDGLRDDEDPPAGRPRWTQPRVDPARVPPVQEAVDDQGDVAHHLHTCARDLDPHFLGKTTTGLAGDRPPLGGTRLRQSDDATRHPGAAHPLDGDTGRSHHPALTDDRCHGRGAPHREGDVTGTAGAEVHRPVVPAEIRVEEDAN